MVLIYYKSYYSKVNLRIILLLMLFSYNPTASSAMFDGPPGEFACGLGLANLHLKVSSDDDLGTVQPFFLLIACMKFKLIGLPVVVTTLMVTTPSHTLYGQHTVMAMAK
jgi:hypothetical protein